MIRAVAFDLLPVLLNVKQQPLTPFQNESAHSFGVISADSDFVHYFAKKSGRSVTDVERITRHVISLIFDVRKPEIFSCLPELKYAVASNHLSFINDWWRTLPIGQNFDAFFTSGDRGLVKLSAAYYYALAKELEESPINILFIDDTSANCEGAAAIGMKEVLFKPSMILSQVVLNNL